MSKRICPIHGIWNKEIKEDRCPKCTKDRNVNYDKNIRDKENNKFYHSTEWKNARKFQLSSFPFCIECGKIADTVDHIKAIKDGGSKLDSSNLQSMCRICHNIKENKEGNRW